MVEEDTVEEVMDSVDMVLEEVMDLADVESEVLVAEALVDVDTVAGAEEAMVADMAAGEDMVDTVDMEDIGQEWECTDMDTAIQVACMTAAT